MAESIPRYADSPFPFTASATIVGGQLVELTATGPTIGPAGANSLKVLGWAGSDAASGAIVPVHTEGVVTCTSSGSITAGDWVIPAASGAVQTIAAVTDFRQGVGVALQTVTTGLPVLVQLRGF